MSGFISWIYQIADAAFVGGAALTSGEADAWAVDFTYHTDVTKQASLIDSGTPANNYDAAPYTKLTYTSPSIKMTRQSDGVWRYVNHNLCLQSQTFGTTWAGPGFGAIGVLTADSTVAPDGTTTADTLEDDNASAFEGFTQAFANLVVGAPYTVSVFILKDATARATRFGLLRLDWNLGANNADCAFDTSTGEVSSALGSTVPIAVGSVDHGTYWKFYVTGIPTTTAGNIHLLPAAGASNFVSYVTTATGSVVAWGAQLKRYPVNDANGFTYSTGYLATTTTAKFDLPYEWDAALASQGILIEEQRTNLLLRSQEFDNAAWTKTKCSITANATTAPDGTTTADKLVEDGTTGEHDLAYLAGGSGVSVTNCAYSVFVKAAERTWCKIGVFTSGNHRAAFVNLATGALGTVSASTTASVVDAGNGWYRVRIFHASGAFVIPYIHPATADTVDNYLGDSASGIYAWGAQLEDATFHTSPIHTIAATVTRAADNISIATSAIPFSTTAGALICNGRLESLLASSVNRIFAGITNGSFAESFYLLYNTTIDPTFLCYDNSGSQAGGASGLDLGTGVTGTKKIGAARAVNDFAAVYDGGTVQTDGAGNLPTPTTLYIGTDSGSAHWFNGYIRQITYLKRRATDGQIQTLTT